MSTIPWSSSARASMHGRIPIQVYNVPPGHETYVRFLGQPVICDIHWVGPKCLPHTEPDCPLCLANWNRHTVGYAPAQRWCADVNGKLNWLSVAVCLSHAVLTECEGKDLRGQVWTLERADSRPRSTLRGKFMEFSKTPVPECFDVVPILEWIWRLYLAELKRGLPPTATGLPAPLNPDVKTILDHMAEDMRDRMDKAAQARNGKGGA